MLIRQGRVALATGEKKAATPGPSAPTNREAAILVEAGKRRLAIVSRNSTHPRSLKLGARPSKGSTPVNRSGLPPQSTNIGLCVPQRRGRERATGPESLQGISANAPSDIMQNEAPAARKSGGSTSPRRRKRTAAILEAQSALKPLGRVQRGIKELTQGAKQAVVQTVQPRALEVGAQVVRYAPLSVGEEQSVSRLDRQTRSPKRAQPSTKATRRSQNALGIRPGVDGHALILRLKPGNRRTQAP